MSPYRAKAVFTVWIRILSDPELAELTRSRITFPDLNSPFFYIKFICTFYPLLLHYGRIWSLISQIGYKYSKSFRTFAFPLLCAHNIFLSLNLVMFRAGFRIRIRIQSGQWIRIRIRNPDPDPGGQK
jgi:hypothetical protein